MWLAQAVLDDRRSRLPVPDRLERVDQHDDVEGETTANVKPDQNLEGKPERDRRRDRKPSRRQKAHHDRQRIRNRIDDAVAK